MTTKYILYMKVKSRCGKVEQIKEYTFKNKKSMQTFEKTKFPEMKQRLELKYPQVELSYEIVPQLIEIKFKDLKVQL